MTVIVLCQTIWFMGVGAQLQKQSPTNNTPR